MNIGMYFCECGESYVSDFPYKAPRCQKDRSRSVQKTEGPTFKIQQLVARLNAQRSSKLEKEHREGEVG